MPALPKFVRGMADVATACLFPLHCLGCGMEGMYLCDVCKHTIPMDGVFCCPVCHTPTIHGTCCAHCAGASALNLVAACTAYQDDWLIGRLIRAWKYQYSEELLGMLQSQISGWLQQYGVLFGPIDLVVPVPIHPWRYAERGFHQAEAVAGIVAEAMGVPMASALRRRRYTKPQARLKKETRRQNVWGAFALKRGENVEGKSILVVDDVYTTGSTMQACAEVLKQAGGAQVMGFSLARG